MLYKRQIAVVHVARSQVGMTETEYRDLLASYGAESSKDLDWSDFKALMKHFEKLGFKSKFKPKPKAKSSKEALQGKVNATKKAMGLTDGYVDSIARRMYGVDSWKWLDAGQLHSLVAAMSYHQKRRQRVNS